MKIVFINVPWMKYYAGEGDEEVLVPDCGYNFQHINGYYYGYGKGLEQFDIKQFEGVSDTDEQVDGVTVVWTAYNRKGENKVIGWYKKATIYKKACESLSLESERTIFKYIIKAPAKEALLLPVEFRLLDAKPMEEGVYFEQDDMVIRDIAMYIHNYQDDQMNFVLKEKDLEGKSVLNYQDFEMYFAKADEFLQKDLYGRALRCFNKAIEMEPDLAIGYECKGSILLSIKMYDEALKVYKRVLEIEPDNEGTTYCLGLLYGLLGQYEESLSYYNAYLKMRKNDVNALAERGIVLYHLGKLDEAKHDIQKAYKKESDNISFKTIMEYMYKIIR